MKRGIAFFLLFTFSVGLVSQTQAFCGFYVAKAGAKLFNKTSQVIFARKGQQNVVTMSNDFQGDVKDFAMVVPVPEVLKREQIRVVKPDIFEKLDDYSGPRLVDYYDSEPCPPEYDGSFFAKQAEMAAPAAVMADSAVAAPDLGVKVEAEYEVGEYTILILSAKESDGLQTWLTREGYAIPPNASEALEPYIKSKLKFFVVKVNLKKYNPGVSEQLRPLQISYTYARFMLPIRLGMANANGDQDMIVYAFAEEGRVETANYRTLPVPTDVEIPEFTRNIFGEFYKAVFDNFRKEKGQNVVYLEYAWDLSSSNFTKCDPCPVQPPTYEELKEAGVFWAEPVENPDPMASDYDGALYMTRLHVRYNRANFPQDLLFNETPNHENFQARYVMRHPATGPFDCNEAEAYLKELKERKQKELQTLYALTGWTAQTLPVAKAVVDKELDTPKFDPAAVKFKLPKLGGFSPLETALIAVLAAILGGLGYRFWRKRKTNG